MKLESLPVEAAEPPALLHPNMAETYPNRIAALQEGLQDSTTKMAVIETFQASIHQVDLVPQNGELSILLRGDLAAMLSFAANKKPGIIAGTGSVWLASQAKGTEGRRSR